MKLSEKIGDYANENSIGSKFRRKRAAHLRRLIDKVSDAKGGVSILDVGGTELYWNIFDKEYLKEKNVKIILYNVPGQLSPVERADIFDAQTGDGCALPFSDGHFDICHSNSVLEHVGNWQRKRAFASETSRVARIFFHQTPNFWFPWEPHFGAPFFHWLPESVRLWAIQNFSIGWFSKAESLDKGMEILEGHCAANCRHVPARN